MFSNTKRLNVLLLTGNKIRELTRCVFLGLSSLRLLDISENKLSAVSDDAFAELLALEELNMQRNELQMLQPGTIARMGSLIYLYLSNNQLTTMEGLKFSKTLRHLELLGNDFNCTCRYLNELSNMKLDSFLSSCNIFEYAQQKSHPVSKCIRYCNKNTRFRVSNCISCSKTPMRACVDKMTTSRNAICVKIYYNQHGNMTSTNPKCEGFRCLKPVPCSSWKNISMPPASIKVGELHGDTSVLLCHEYLNKPKTNVGTFLIFLICLGPLILKTQSK